MQSFIYVPDSLQAAGDHVKLALCGRLEHLSKEDFQRAWCSIVYLFPGLHPNEFFESGSRWPFTARRLAAEAWRRFEAGELTENELYCYQAATTRIEREMQEARPWLFHDHFNA